MSVQFGKWSFDGKPIDPDYLEKVQRLLTPYGPDRLGSYSNKNITLIQYAFHTTKESQRERQPHVAPSGIVVLWDGRLDNRTELISGLGGAADAHSTDVEIVAAAYERWRTDCFAKLIGDWALSIWDERSGSLTLAKDPIGTRHLYYSIENDQVTWSTILDPLVLFSGKTFQLCEEYIAGWFSFFPAVHLTPYVGINSVPPASVVLVRPKRHEIRGYWCFNPEKRIHYRNNSDYEEHFRLVFSNAVHRRLRSDRPILAELSGGMDSSSIVCVADTITAREHAAGFPRIDTLSYYDDSEPNWNERPYFTKVEERRGRQGIHIDVSSNEQLKLEAVSDRFMATPASGSLSPAVRSACTRRQENRVVLSGTGGDEVTGGVPTPTPEIADLLTSGRFGALAHALKIWALNKRKPWFHLFCDAVREFLPLSLLRVPPYRRPAAWLTPEFVKRNLTALQGYQTRLKVLGPSPAFQANIATLQTLQRQLGCEVLSPDLLREKRYPYLDRDLLEFMYSVPRDQVVRPGQRRSLMRRALAGIVPDEILNRKRKAYVARSPMTTIATQLKELIEMCRDMRSSSLGIVNSHALQESFEEAARGHEVPIVLLMRTICIESWLRSSEYWNPASRSKGTTIEFPLQSLSRHARSNNGASEALTNCKAIRGSS